MERVGDKIPPENLDFIKLKLLEAFSDNSASIRNSISNVITALFIKIGFSKWPELLEYLSSNLDQGNVEVVLSSLECISKILEDLGMESENFNYFEEKQNSSLTTLIPKLLTLCDAKFPTKIRTLALHSLNLFTSMMPSSFLANMHRYLEICFIIRKMVNPKLDNIVVKVLLRCLRKEKI